MRVFADEDFAVGTTLDLEVMTPHGAPIRCWARVVWRVELDGQSPARFDVGLKFVDMAEDDVQRLAQVLVRPAHEA